MLVFRIGHFQHVEANGKVGVGRVEIDDVVDAARRDRGKNLLHQFAVRIHHRHAPAVADILDGEVFEHHGFTDAGFTDDVHVLPSVARFNAEDPVLSPEIGAGEIYGCLVVEYRRPRNCRFRWRHSLSLRWMHDSRPWWSSGRLWWNGGSCSPRNNGFAHSW